ncbi:sensor histidine kinase [Alicyclobacillus fastidiosus]|uniref:histidine kinase n=1 Tax=Alicyclobacillus fastidiosus TaxID=392011 RepID=A0ABV5ALG1_9BACL|nr:histidine kinase [Alicyclobacillus fastidiosus]WEH11066.1 histidine kinase [Alicyclobacillus fastidiosus]
MIPLRIKISLFLIPAIVIGLFETLRHTLLENILPIELGNWLTACIDAGVIALVARSLFLAYANKERELSRERASRAVMEERERLARVLHDQIAQSIFYSGVQVSAAKVKLQQGRDGSVEQNLNDVLLSLREIDENVRQAIFNLKQDTIGGSDFRKRIRLFLDKTLSGKSISWDLEMSEGDITLSAADQVQLFGILQEGITNIVKHSKATQVTVRLMSRSEDNAHWSFTIQDNGIGFNLQNVRDGRYGMEIMANRARDIGADFHVESSPGNTQIRVER